jgi:putative methyltransferase (TIGR04325 family)
MRETRPRRRQLLRELIPPVLLSSAARVRARLAHDAPRGQEWEYLRNGWPAATERDVSGWNIKAVAHAYEQRWPALIEALRDTGPVGISLEVPASWRGEILTDDREAHNTLMSYAYVLARTARGASRVSMLDWGGGLGHYYLISRALFPELEIAYTCKEVSAVCERGRELLPAVTFVDDDSCLQQQYDLVLASSSIEYVEAWQTLARRLAAAARSYLYLARVPTARTNASYVVLQRAQRYGYDTEYVSWIFNRDELIECVTGASMQLVREFVCGADNVIRGAPERVESRGFLFAPER